MERRFPRVQPGKTDEVEPGTSTHVARGKPSSSKIGRSIQENARAVSAGPQDGLTPAQPRSRSASDRRGRAGRRAGTAGEVDARRLGPLVAAPGQGPPRSGPQPGSNRDRGERHAWTEPLESVWAAGRASCSSTRALRPTAPRSRRRDVARDARARAGENVTARRVRRRRRPRMKLATAVAAWEPAAAPRARCTSRPTRAARARPRSRTGRSRRLARRPREARRDSDTPTCMWETPAGLSSSREWRALLERSVATTTLRATMSVGEREREALASAAVHRRPRAVRTARRCRGHSPQARRRPRHAERTRPGRDREREPGSACTSWACSSKNESHRAVPRPSDATSSRTTCSTSRAGSGGSSSRARPDQRR